MSIEKVTMEELRQAYLSRLFSKPMLLSEAAELGEKHGDFWVQITISGSATPRICGVTAEQLKTRIIKCLAGRWMRVCQVWDKVGDGTVTSNTFYQRMERMANDGLLKKKKFSNRAIQYTAV